MDKNHIENYIIINNIDITSLSSMQLITIIMEQVETIKDLKGNDKKIFVINLLKEIINNDDNIFIKSNNLNLIVNINQLFNSAISLSFLFTTYNYNKTVYFFLYLWSFISNLTYISKII